MLEVSNLCFEKADKSCVARDVVQAQAWAKEAGIPVVCAYHTHFAQYLTYYHLGALEGAIWRIMNRFYNECIHTYVPTSAVQQELQVSRPNYECDRRPGYIRFGEILDPPRCHRLFGSWSWRCVPATRGFALTCCS